MTQSTETREQTQATEGATLRLRLFELVRTDEHAQAEVDNISGGMNYAIDCLDGGERVTAHHYAAEIAALMDVVTWDGRPSAAEGERGCGVGVVGVEGVEAPVICGHLPEEHDGEHCYGCTLDLGIEAGHAFEGRWRRARVRRR